MATRNISEKIIEDFVMILIISLIKIFENDSNESVLCFFVRCDKHLSMFQRGFDNLVVLITTLLF